MNVLYLERCEPGQSAWWRAQLSCVGGQAAAAQQLGFLGKQTQHQSWATGYQHHTSSEGQGRFTYPCIISLSLLRLKCLNKKFFLYILDTRYKTVEGHERAGCCVEDDTGHVDFVKCNCILMVFCVLSMLSMICSKGSIDSEKKDLKRWNDLHDVRMTRVPVSPVSPAQAHCWWYPGPGLELDTALDMTTLNCTGYWRLFMWFKYAM